MDISYLIILVLFTHWFGDFVLQTDWEAKNKSKNNVALASHVWTYTLVLILLAFGLAAIDVALFRQLEFLLAWALMNGAIHFCVDYVSSRCSSYYYAKGDAHNFFVVVGFDQWIHAATLILTFSVMLTY